MREPLAAEPNGATAAGFPAAPQGAVCGAVPITLRLSHSWRKYNVVAGREQVRAESNGVWPVPALISDTFQQRRGPREELKSECDPTKPAFAPQLPSGRLISLRAVDVFELVSSEIKGGLEIEGLPPHSRVAPRTKRRAKANSVQGVAPAWNDRLSHIGPESGPEASPSWARRLRCNRAFCELLGIRRSADIPVGVFPGCPCAATRTGRQESALPPATRECARCSGSVAVGSNIPRPHILPSAD